MKRGITMEALLSLDEEQIRECFSDGARKVGKERWEPADEGQAVRTLDELLRDKRKRQAPPRLLHRDSSHGYTDFPGRAMPREPEAVPESDQQRFSEAARTNFEITHAEEQRRAEMRSYLARLRQLGIEQIKAGNDPRPVLEAAVAQMEERRKAA